MLKYLRKEIREAHVTVWWVSSIVTIALIGVVSWDEYKQAHRAPPTTAITSAPHG